MMGLMGICLLLSSFLGYHMWQQYHVRQQEHVDRARHDMLKLSQSMTTTIQLSVEVIDQMLKRIIDRQYTNQLFGGNLHEDVRHSIALWAAENQWVDAVLMTDKEGQVNVSYTKAAVGPEMTSEALLSAGEQLKHADGDDKAVFFSTVLTVGNEKNTKAIVIGRRMEDVDGTIKGTVAVVVNIANIKNTLQSVTGGYQSKLALLLDNKDVITLQDIQELEFTNIQAIIGNAAALSDTSNTPYVGEQLINGSRRFISVQGLSPLPVSLLLIEDEKDVLALWHVDTMRYYQWIAGVGALLLLAGALVILLLKYCHRQAQRADKIQALMQGKSYYFVRASEKLVTPVHAITGFSQMLSEEYFGQMNKEQKQRLNDIQQCSNQVLESVGHISELISADMGILALHEEQVDVTSVIHGCMQLFAGKLVEHKITLIDQTIKYHVMIQADSRRIRHMVLHLLSNAIQYTPVGGKVTLTTGYDNQQNFFIEITDSGEGIGKPELKKILHPFESDMPDDKEARKVSIGLPLCHLYASLHGGRLEIKSKLGSGTKILVTIPKQRVIEQRTHVYGSNTATLVT